MKISRIPISEFTIPKHVQTEASNILVHQRKLTDIEIWWWNLMGFINVVWVLKKWRSTPLFSGQGLRPVPAAPAPKMERGEGCSREAAVLPWSPRSKKLPWPNEPLLPCKALDTLSPTSRQRSSCWRVEAMPSLPRCASLPSLRTP